VIIWQH